MGANLKEVRERISSVINTQQITKAMKMVSAAKLRKAQQAVVQIRPYSNKLNEMLSNILANTEGEFSSTFGSERQVNQALIIVITSDKGLCGAFNTNIIKAAQALIYGKYAEVHSRGGLSLMCIGKRGYEYFKKRFEGPINRDFIDLFSDLSFQNAAGITGLLMESYSRGSYDAIDVAYGQFKNAGVQICKSEPFLPVSKPAESIEDKPGTTKYQANYIFEPSEEFLLKELVPSILKTQFFRFLLDNLASEHGARMTAMDKATENANELLKELRINYNKARQEAITRELSEIVGGVAALEG